MLLKVAFTAFHFSLFFSPHSNYRWLSSAAAYGKKHRLDFGKVATKQVRRLMWERQTKRVGVGEVEGGGRGGGVGAWDGRRTSALHFLYFQIWNVWNCERTKFQALPLHANTFYLFLFESAVDADDAGAAAVGIGATPSHRQMARVCMLYAFCGAFAALNTHICAHWLRVLVYNPIAKTCT